MASRYQKKVKKSCPSTGILHVKATFNNTMITVTNLSGDVIAWASGGFHQKGARKSTPSVAEDVGRQLGSQVQALGMTEVKVYLKGMGPGREHAIRGFHYAGIKVIVIVECTGNPHNGCKPKKKRRV